MRASLYLADETYLTFSAYFHVIHCIQSVKTTESIYAINHLLIKNPTLFKEICKVSAIENLGFMFHYVKKPVEEFRKKTAKYLARISHALSLYKSIDKLPNTIPSLNAAANEAAANEATSNEAEADDVAAIKSNIINELKAGTLGNHDYIIEKYKYNNTNAAKRMTLDNNNTLYKCYNNSTSSEILKELYNKLTNETINSVSSDKIFGDIEIVIEPKLEIVIEPNDTYNMLY